MLQLRDYELTGALVLPGVSLTLQFSPNGEQSGLRLVQLLQSDSLHGNRQHVFQLVGGLGPDGLDEPGHLGGEGEMAGGSTHLRQMLGRGEGEEDGPCNSVISNHSGVAGV